MIVIAPFIRDLWLEVFCELYPVGKVAMFPMLVVFTATLTVLALGETIIIDPLAILLVLFTKEMSVRELFDFYWSE